MKAGEPSRTALGAASHRAAHQVIEGGVVFHDPLAFRILGPDAGAAVEKARRDPDKRWMRWFIALRTRFAEDAIANEFLARELRALGFPLVEDLRSSEIAARYFLDRGDERSRVGGHVLRAVARNAARVGRSAVQTG